MKGRKLTLGRNHHPMSESAPDMMAAGRGEFAESRQCYEVIGASRSSVMAGTEKKGPRVVCSPSTSSVEIDKLSTWRLKKPYIMRVFVGGIPRFQNELLGSSSIGHTANRA